MRHGAARKALFITQRKTMAYLSSSRLPARTYPTTAYSASPQTDSSLQANAPCSDSWTCHGTSMPFQVHVASSASAWREAGQLRVSSSECSFGKRHCGGKSSLFSQCLSHLVAAALTPPDVRFAVCGNKLSNGGVVGSAFSTYHTGHAISESPYSGSMTKCRR
jgi:hypothetical protein